MVSTESAYPYVFEQAFQAKNSSTWLCLVGNVKKWKSGPVFLNTRIKGEELRLEAQLSERSGDGFIIYFQWNKSEV